MQHLFFEKSVNSFGQLMKEIELLDLDSGVRTFGDFKGKKQQFVFITRSPHDGYTLMAYERKGESDGRAIPGRRLDVKEFQSVEELGKFLRGILSRAVRAYIY